MNEPVACLLGPQRFEPTVSRALEDLGIDGPIAVVTAGWQEREGEDQELRDHIARPLANLELYRRCEDVFRDDPELFHATRDRQDRLRDLQRVYRARLDHLIGAVRALMERSGEPWLLEPEREDAIRAIRALDIHHLGRIREIHDDFEYRWRPRDRVAVARHREELSRILSQAAALAIAGGHVAILNNRLRLFDPFGLRRDLPIVAWSAGAMAVVDRIFLFHDSPPQGAGSAEVLDVGHGRCPGIVPLPHASGRLRLDDPHRVSILARRVAPDVAVAFDPGTRMVRRHGAWTGSRGTRRLDGSGSLVEVEAA